MATQVPTLSSYIAQLQTEQKAANAANQARLNQTTALYDEIIQQYSPGGSFGAGMEKQLAESKRTSVGSGAQSLVDSGFANSTMMANLGTTWEKKVGSQARLNMEDMRNEKLSAAKMGKSAMIERVQDEGPDDSLIAQLIQQASNKPGTITTTAPSKMGSIFDGNQSERLGSDSTPTPSSGFNSPYWTNGQWAGVPSSGNTSTPAQRMDESDFQSLVNQNMKNAKKATNPFMESEYNRMLRTGGIK